MDPAFVGLAGLILGAVVAMVAGGLVSPGEQRGPIASLRGLIPTSAELLFGKAHGPKEWLELLEDPVVQEAIAEIEAHGAKPKVVGCELELEGVLITNPTWEARLQSLVDAMKSKAFKGWRQVAARHGLRPNVVGRRFKGLVQGLPVIVDIEGHIASWNARIDFEFEVAPDLLEEAKRELRHRKDVLVHPRGLVLVASEREPEDALMDAYLLARDTHRLERSDWNGLLKSLDLVETGRNAAAGKVDDLVLNAEQKANQVHIHVRLKHPLPRGTLLIHADHGVIDHIVGDPVIDPLLTVQTSDVPELTRRIAVDGIREPLLDLVHGLRGSFVDAERVVAVVGKPWRDLDEAAAKVIALVQALDAQVEDADQASRTSKA